MILLFFSSSLPPFFSLYFWRRKWNGKKWDSSLAGFLKKWIFRLFLPLSDVYVYAHLLKYFFICTSGWGTYSLFLMKGLNVWQHRNKQPLWLLKGFSFLFLFFFFISLSLSFVLSFFFDFSPVNNLWCFKFLFLSFFEFFFYCSRDEVYFFMTSAAISCCLESLISFVCEKIFRLMFDCKTITLKFISKIRFFLLPQKRERTVFGFLLFFNWNSLSEKIKSIKIIKDEITI